MSDNKTEPAKRTMGKTTQWSTEKIETQSLIFTSRMEKGKIQTVLGPVTPDDLGVTLCHEHLSMSFGVSYTPAPPRSKHMEDVPLCMEHLGWIRQNPYSHKNNLVFNDEPAEQAVTEDLKLFKKSGGGSIVENSTFGLQRNLEFVRNASKLTGVNVIAGTGYYVGPSLPAAFDGWTEEQLVAEMTKDLTVGVGDSGAKCGVIGEIGCCWPLDARERKSLRATGQAQAALGCPVIIHPGRHPDSPSEIVRILTEAGARANKVVMSHLDRTLLTKESVLEFAQLGCYCEYDLFGIETSFYQLCPEADMPGDAERIRRIKWLLEEGHGDQVLISHDIHTKHRLAKFGGHGFSHIMENVVPMMLQRGIDQATIDHILVENPKRWLTV